jgi:hypothetical protein
MSDSLPKSLAVLSKEITLLMKYGAPEDKLPDLHKVLEKYSSDAIALNVFHNFYSFLPEALEDGITMISRIAARHGAFLFCATTLSTEYLYLATRESATLVGPFSNTIEDQEILNFFGWPDDEHFRKAVGEPANRPEHVPVNESLKLCPACGTGDSEIHAFGCPVEVCPWCDGQLTNCECRFSKTGLTQFSRDSHLDDFLDLLTEKGRVPFAADRHRPSFMHDEDIDLNG